MNNEISNQLLETIDASFPEKLDIDALSLYNDDLVNKLIWIQELETWLDRKTSLYFFSELKISYKANLVILLDHSSSISYMDQEYKRATVAFCKALVLLACKILGFCFQ